MGGGVVAFLFVFFLFGFFLFVLFIFFIFVCFVSNLSIACDFFSDACCEWFLLSLFLSVHFGIFPPAGIFGGTGIEGQHPLAFCVGKVLCFPFWQEKFFQIPSWSALLHLTSHYLTQLFLFHLHPAN